MENSYYKNYIGPQKSSLGYIHVFLLIETESEVSLTVQFFSCWKTPWKIDKVVDFNVEYQCYELK